MILCKEGSKDLFKEDEGALKELHHFTLVIFIEYFVRDLDTYKSLGGKTPRERI